MMKIENFQHAKNPRFLSMNMKILVLVLLGILVIMSFVQGMQINALEKSFGGTGSAVKTTSNSVNVPAYNQPAASAPAMVGGC